MRFIGFVALIFLVQISRADKFMVLCGRITACDNSSLGISGLELILISSDGHRWVTHTNKDGDYRFIKDSSGAFIFKENTKYMLRANSLKSNNYLTSSLRLNFLVDTLHSIIKTEDFCLCSNRIVHYFPGVYFKLNSVNDTIVNINNGSKIKGWFTSIDTSVDFLFNYLTDNPNRGIDIFGYASEDEANPELLSLNRSQIIKDRLVALGIPSNRLFLKGQGKRAPFLDNQTNGSSYLRKCVLIGWHKDGD